MDACFDPLEKAGASGKRLHVDSCGNKGSMSIEFCLGKQTMPLSAPMASRFGARTTLLFLHTLAAKVTKVQTHSQAGRVARGLEAPAGPEPLVSMLEKSAFQALPVQTSMGPAIVSQ